MSSAHELLCAKIRFLIMAHFNSPFNLCAKIRFLIFAQRSKGLILCAKMRFLIFAQRSKGLILCAKMHFLIFAQDRFIQQAEAFGQIQGVTWLLGFSPVLDFPCISYGAGGNYVESRGCRRGQGA